MLSARLEKRLSGGFVLDVAFTAEAGVTILFGASGSGKTILLRCLAGLTTPDAGRVVVGRRVLFDGERGIAVPVPARRVGFVFQQLALFPHLTVAANIAYGIGRGTAAERTARVQAIADSFRIGHLLVRRPPQISGGERQRVALARSLVTDPELLLLDEPLSALDYATQSRIIADLRAWNAERRIPLLYVTHSHREVFALGERVVLLERGRIVADGHPNAVMESPAGEAIARMTGFENVFSAQVTTQNPENGTMECRIAGTAVTLEVPLFAAGSGEPIELAVRAGDILVARDIPRGLSARNVLPAVVQAIRREGTTVVLNADAGHAFEVHVTLGALQALELSVGARVWLVVKTHAFRRIGPPDRPGDDAAGG